MSITNVKRYYTDPEWDARILFYQQQLNMIRVPEQPSPIDVKRLQSQVSNLMDEVLLDLHYARMNWEYYSDMLKAIEAELYLQFKNPPTTGAAAPVKRTEKEVTSLVHQALNQSVQNQSVTNLQLGPTTIFSVLHAYKEREGYMKTLQKMLDTKNQALMIDLGVLKLEFNVDGSRSMK